MKSCYLLCEQQHFALINNIINLLDLECYQNTIKRCVKSTDRITRIVDKNISREEEKNETWCRKLYYFLITNYGAS